MSGTAIYQELTGDDGKRVAIDAWRKYPVPIGRRDDWTSGKKNRYAFGLGLRPGHITVGRIDGGGKQGCRRQVGHGKPPAHQIASHGRPCGDMVQGLRGYLERLIDGSLIRDAVGFFDQALGHGIDGAVG